MERLKFDSGRPADEVLVEQLAADPRIQALLARYHAGKEAIARDPYLFADWLKTQEAIRRPDYGQRYYPDLQIIDGYPSTVMRLAPQAQQQRDALAHRKNYLYCDLSPDALQFSLDGLDVGQESREYQEAYQTIVRWLRVRPEKGIYLYGSLGVGKTWLLAGMTNALAKEGVKVAFVNVPRFAAQARRNVGTRSDDDGRLDYMEAVLRRLKRAEVLVLDDIGSETITNWVRDDVLFPLLDYRMENRRATFFTSNCDPQDLGTRLLYNQYGQKDELKAARIMERVRTLAVPMRLSGTSRRK
jgi:primosomal protein DnaI